MSSRHALARLFTLLALTAAMPILAAGARIDVTPAAPDAGSPLQLRISGEWKDGCVPRATGVRVEGPEVVLEALAASGDCAGESRSYSIGTADIGGSSLRLDANGVYRLRFEVRPAPEAAAELHGFRLLYVGKYPDPGFVPETGFWWPEAGAEFSAGPGLGVQMEVQSRTLSMSVFGYGADGEPTWTLGAAPLLGHVAEVELSRLRDGAGPFVDYRAPKELSTAGSAHLQLLTPSRATMWFVRLRADGRGLEAEAVSMVRFRFAQQAEDAWLGRWVVLAERANGFPTLRIDFDSATRDARGFELTSAAPVYRLRCEYPADRPNSPPTRCRLRDGDGTAIDVDFHHVALNELRGFTGGGERIVALKLMR